MCRLLSRLKMAHPPPPEHTGHAGRPRHSLLPYTIRPACPADAQHLPALERDAARAFATIAGLEWLAGGDVLPLAAHRASIARHTCWVGVDATGRLLGFISACPYGNDLHIQEMSVALAAQGHGLGRSLLRTACQAAQALGLERITLTTFANIPWNAPFYASAGFCSVPSNALDTRLAAVLAQEQTLGFDPATRCAMQYVLPRAVQCVSK